MQVTGLADLSEGKCMLQRRGTVYFSHFINFHVLGLWEWEEAFRGVEAIPVTELVENCFKDCGSCTAQQLFCSEFGANYAS